MEPFLQAYRVTTKVKNAGEIVIRGLPVRKEQEVEVIVLAGHNDGDERELFHEAADHAPSLSFLHDDAEDIYDEADIKGALR